MANFACAIITFQVMVFALIYSYSVLEHDQFPTVSTALRSVGISCNSEPLYDDVSAGRQVSLVLLIDVCEEDILFDISLCFTHTHSLSLSLSLSPLLLLCFIKVLFCATLTLVVALK